MASRQQMQNAVKPVSLSAMKADSDLRKSPFDQSENQGGLDMGVVMSVDYELFTVSIRVLSTNYQHMPISLTLPGAGKRHFLGAMPEIGDTCLIGWSQQANGATRQPVILGWVLTGATAGHDWWSMQDHSPDEWGYSAKERVQWEGIADRHRYKLRHMLPGNVVASSSQGADLILDESATLANRRGNEIRLRDQDQALVVRTLQQFHVGAGFRTYQGMVQRDAQLLPTSMVSDGTDWDADLQVNTDGSPLKASQLAKSTVSRGRLTPSPVFDAATGMAMDTWIDPYLFLQNAMLIDNQGRVTARTNTDALYGGKPYYRVSTDGKSGAADTQADILTEYRIELTHTSDGILPVTEQTDGFDADRLPGTLPTDGGVLNTAKMPFIEFVLGSVVGNDPFSLSGKVLYGIPLRPVVFPDPHTGDTLPSLASGLGYGLEDHAAMLLSVRNPMDPKAQPTWFSLTKAGAVRASVAPVSSGASIEVAAASGVHLGVGKSPTTGIGLQVDSDGPIVLNAAQGDSKTNRGIVLTSTRGAVRIFGGQSETTGMPGKLSSGKTLRNRAPAVTLESGQGMLLKATSTLQISAPTVAIQNAAKVSVDASSAVQIAAGDNISMSSKTLDQTTMGKATQTYGGPKDSSPANGALRETKFVGNPATGFLTGAVDKYSAVYGDREETFTAGSHTTSILVGNMTYKTDLGTYKAQSGLNSLQITSGSIQAQAVAGVVTVSAAAGAVNISAGTACTVSAVGLALIKGATVTLQASLPGSKTGALISGADCDPVSGTPLSLLGMGSFGHTIVAG